MLRRMYMQVTQDEMQLPELVADTICQLARLAETSPYLITKDIREAQCGNPPPFPKYVQVIFDDDDDESDLQIM